MIAHSFGTYLISKALKEPDIKIFRLLICGSVVGEDFRPAHFRGQILDSPILNDCGTHDVYPVLAKTVTWGYGATGTFGLGTVGVRDRFNKFGHGDYFSEAYVRSHWLPFISKGEVVPSEWERVRKAPPYWLSALSAFPLKWALLGVITTALLWPVIARPPAKATLDPTMAIQHYIGASNVYAVVTFENPQLSVTSFYNFQGFLTSPSKATVQMEVDSMLDAFSHQQVQLPYVTVQPLGQLKFGFVMYDPAIRSSIIHEKIRQWGAQKELDSLNFLEDKQNVDHATVSQLINEFEKKFKWTPGDWSLEFRYVIGDQQYSERKTFSVSEHDIEEMKKSLKLYPRGLGVFPNWRLLDENGQNYVAICKGDTNELGRAPTS